MTLKRMSPEDAAAYKERVLSAARKNPDMTREALGLRFASVSLDRIDTWLREAGIRLAKPFDGFSSIGHSRRKGRLTSLVAKHKRGVRP